MLPENSVYCSGAWWQLFAINFSEDANTIPSIIGDGLDGLFDLNAGAVATALESSPGISPIAKYTTIAVGGALSLFTGTAVGGGLRGASDSGEIVWSNIFGTAGRANEEQRQAERREEVLKRLDSLSAQEVSYAADALRAESPIFYTYIHSPAVSVLRGKGLVWTPGGQHNEDRYPFSFCDFVWDQLLARKDEFIDRDLVNKTAAALRRAS